MPIKRVVAWTVLLKVLNPRDRLLDARPMAGWHPPHHQIPVLEVLKPFRAAAVKLLVNGLVDKALERFDVLPDGQVDGDLWIGIGPRAGGVAALVYIAPDETRCALGQAVHPREIVREICHTWIVNLVSNAADVQLCKMMIGRLLQGFHSVADERDEFTPYQCTLWIASKTIRTQQKAPGLATFLAIIVFEARAISGRRLRQGFSQSKSDQNSQRRATRHAVYQESQNSLHTPL